MRIVVGVAGSIAAYKAPGVIRLLRAGSHEVRAVPTAAALRFIGAPALAAVSGHPVATGVFDDPAAVEHVALGEWAQLVLVAPASADLLARVRAGRADDLLTATILTTTAPVVLAPAMHTQMWDNPATVDNVATLRARGMTVIDPDVGALTSGDSGRGRFPEPERVVAQALGVAGLRAGRGAFGGDDAAAHRPGSVSPAAEAGAGGPGQAPWVGRHVVVSAGGTHEPIDPVRFLGNRSSGRQGVAIAAEAARRGASATLVAANVSAQVLDGLPVPGTPGTARALETPGAAGGSQAPGAADQSHEYMRSQAAAVAGPVRVVRVETALELEAAVREAARTADVVVMAAAVADYRPQAVRDTKIKKTTACGAGEAGGLTLRLVENPDVLAGLVSDPPRADGRCVVVGFAAETGDADGDVLDHGAAKARRKGADLLAVNAVGGGLGFGDVPNAVVLLDAAGQETGRVAGTKAQVAAGLLDAVGRLLGDQED